MAGCLQPPPAVERYWNVTPLPGVTAMKALSEFAFKLARIMTPALAQPSVFCTAGTRAVMVQLPLLVR